MQRLYLDVPFDEKDQARALGAKWDKRARRWYIFTNQERSAFARWLSEALPSDIGDQSQHRAPSGIDRWVNVKAPSFYLARVHTTCFRCEMRTPVFGFVLPRTYESMALQLSGTLSDGHNPNTIYSYPDFIDWLNTQASRCWVSQGVEAIPHSIYYLNDVIVSLMRERAPTYRKIKQQWTNTCSHCKGVIADANKAGEPLIMPRSSTAAAYSELFPIAAPFEAGAQGLATGIEFVQRMEIKSW